MNADSGRIIPAFASLLTVVVFALATECGAEPTETRLPRQLIDSSTREATELRWRNGEKLKGEPASADQNDFRWQSALFTEAITLPYREVSRVDFAERPPSTSPGGAFRFILADGSHLTGDLQSINAQSVSFTSNACGEAVLKLDQLLAIERISGPGIIAAGPASLLRGDSTANGRFAKNPVYLSAAGEVAFLEFNGGVRQPLDLPEKCLVRLRLRIEVEPAFSLLLSGKTQSVRLETWGDELVLTHGDRFASAGAAAVSDEGVLDVAVAWDQAAGTWVLFDRDGKPKAELTLKGDEVREEPAPPRRSLLGSLPLIGGKIEELMEETGLRKRPQTRQARPDPEGITLTNIGAGFVVERYSVTESSGPPPEAIPADSGGVETGGEFISGAPLACDGTRVTVQTELGVREVPLEAVRSLRWSRPAIAGPEEPRTSLWYSDGNLVRGILLGIADGKAQLQTPFADEPLFATLAHARALVFPIIGDPVDPNKAEVAERPLAEMDTITADDLVLHGTMQAAGGVLPGFVPVGSATAMIPVANDNLMLRRHLRAEESYPRAPALIDTKDHESLPVTVDQFDAHRIAFHWDAAAAKEVATSEIHAVHFPEPAVEMKQGFEAAGWRFFGKRELPAKESESGLVLEPDTAIGHPYLLHGEDFSFRFRAVDRQPSFRVRLFCLGTDRTSESINFLVAHYGSTIYAGSERGQDGQFYSNQTIEVGPSGEPILVEFRFNEKVVEMRVNNVVAGSSGLPSTPGGKTGAGLVIEPAAVWGNSFGAVALSDFSMSGMPVGVSAPAFSDDARREALLLPRLRREVPPRHILIGGNGDLLRGEIEAKSGKDVLFRVGLEQYKVPLDRIAAAIWVEEADKTMDDVKKKAAEAEDTPAAKKAEARKAAQASAKNTEKAKSGEILESYSEQWIDLTNGGRVKLEVEAWNPESVVGTHPILGLCSIPTALVHRVMLKEPAPSSASAALSNWKFEHTIDPNPPGQEEADVSPLVGKPAPDVSLKLVGGENFQLSKAKGKVVVLDFWATWCGPCVRSLPDVITAMAGFPSDKVAFVAVNQGETQKQIEQFMEVRGFIMPVALDPDMKAGAKFDVESIPYTVVIDPAGTVTYVSLGASPDGASKLADAVTKALGASASE